MATAIMKQKGFPEMDDVEEIISKISEDSPYKRRPTQKRTWMTVPEMGKLLGLKKTDRYWLVHKNVFESKEIAGKIRINIASFEKWYANQIKYHKVTGEEPGKELKSWSYSVKEVADLLGVDDYLVYELLKKNQMEAVIVDYWKRIPKESFQKSNIEYDALIQANKFDEKLVQGIFELILETVVSQSNSILVASEIYPAAMVKSKFLKLNYMHIDYVISCMKKNTTKVKNIKKYLLAALFNAPLTIDGYYQAEVNADMPHWTG